MVFPDGTVKEGLFENNVFVGTNLTASVGYASNNN
jgi:hypothetical protein